MELKQAFDEIRADLPWVDRVRLVVGKLSSREAVKDALLEQCEVLPEGAVGSLATVATEIVRRGGNSQIVRPLSVLSQCDALERIAATGFLKEKAPDLCRHLRNRQVARKVSRFLTELDRFWVRDADLEALAETFGAKDRALGFLIEAVARLWGMGQLRPWSDGEIMRKGLEVLEQSETRVPENIWLWATADFTPLEEALVEALSAAGAKVQFLHPDAITGQITSHCESIGMSSIPFSNAGVLSDVWRPHTVFDELEFLRDELSVIRKDCNWNEIALFVPDDPLYKRLVRGKLLEWNVPILDPTLKNGWKEKAVWLWWRDLLRIVATGLRVEDVCAWLGDSPEAGALIKKVYEDGVHGGARGWARLQNEVELPGLKLLVEAAALFSRVMSIAEFGALSTQLIESAQKHLGAEQVFEPELLDGFVQHLHNERPYLEGFRARLPRFVSFFEEYLDVKSRTESLRCASGVRFVTHGVWLPESPRHSFVLGASLIRRMKPPSDAWEWSTEWEQLEVRKAWSRLHFGLSREGRLKRDEAFLTAGLFRGGDVRVSFVATDLEGNPLSDGALKNTIDAMEPPVPTVAGGHARTGWLMTQKRADAATSIVRPDLSAKFSTEGLRVSAFEDYLQCPFLFYARHVLELERPGEVGLDPDAMARGRVLHGVLESLLREEIDAGRLDSSENLRARIPELVAEEVRAGKLYGMYRHEPLVEKTVSAMTAQLNRWLDWELANRAAFPGMKPVALELPVTVECIPGLKLRGKVDRIDSDGEVFAIVDYKSGTAKFVGKELLSGAGVQLMAYCEAVRKARGEEPAAAYYLTVGRKVEGGKGIFRKNYSGRVHSANARNTGVVDAEWGVILGRALERWTTEARKLLAGDFSARPLREKDCSRCVYSNICGKQS